MPSSKYVTIASAVFSITLYHLEMQWFISLLVFMFSFVKCYLNPNEIKKYQIALSVLFLETYDGVFYIMSADIRIVVSMASVLAMDDVIKFHGPENILV